MRFHQLYDMIGSDARNLLLIMRGIGPTDALEIAKASGYNLVHVVSILLVLEHLDLVEKFDYHDTDYWQFEPRFFDWYQEGRKG